MFANNRNRVRRAVLGLSQDRACSNLGENFRENSLKRDLSNDTTVNPPLFSFVNTFKLKSKAIHTQCLFSTNLVISLMNLRPLGRRKEMGAAFLGPVMGARRRRISA